MKPFTVKELAIGSAALIVGWGVLLNGCAPAKRNTPAATAAPAVPVMPTLHDVTKAGGAHRQIDSDCADIIKADLKDPSSYQHTGTSYRVRDELPEKKQLFVVSDVSYSATNSFGGRVHDTAQCVSVVAPAGNSLVSVTRRYHGA